MVWERAPRHACRDKYTRTNLSLAHNVLPYNQKALNHTFLVLSGVKETEWGSIIMYGVIESRSGM